MATISTISDIFNRPPAISEDTLQYTLYPRDDLSDRASATTLAALMCSHVDSLLPGHLWHRDAFELKVVKDADRESWILEGRMRVGDCVDDEWCAVWLLREISAKWDVAISVFDSDGEFLLIEAAEALPSWVTPTNAKNRVWLYGSRLHLIPLTHVSALSSKPRRSRYRYLNNKDSDDDSDDALLEDEENYLSVSDALSIVRDPLADTMAPPAVEQHVWNRISGYPSAARQHVHVTKAYLPLEIAKALAVDPSLVQKPVETFYTRDALQLRAAHKMARFPPEPSTLALVKLTRTAYAQLVGQRFYPPKVFGRWKEQESTKEWRWHDIGMKIACGFEMTYQESKGRTEASRLSAEAIESSAAARKETLRRNHEYVQYIQNLVSSGYFKGEIEGSLFWNTLEDKAVDAFLDARNEDDTNRPSFAASFNSALSSAGDVSIPSTGDEDEDPDSWLNVNAKAFDSTLEQSFKPDDGSSETMDIDNNNNSPGSAEDRATKLQAERLHSFAKKVEEFVGAEGDIQGVRFDDEQSSDEECGVDGSSQMAGDSEPDSLEEAQDGGSAADQAQRRADMAKLVPPLDPSEYGIMPASHYANSQRVAPITIETEVRDDIYSETTVTSGFVTRQRPIRPPIIPRDKYDGVDSDDETDEEGGEEEDEEDQPQIVGDIEIDMEGEKEEFLEFARQALGVSDEQWGHIVRERESRGAYVPSQAIRDSRNTTSTSTSDTSTSDTSSRHSNGATTRPSQQDTSQDTSPLSPQLVTASGPNSFEAVMQAMDAELHRVRSNAAPQSRSVDKGEGKAASPTVQNADIEAAMDADLQAALKTEHDSEGDDDYEGGEGQLDYNLIKNFLESFKSQGGQSGPVGNLAGRLQPGWALPRDES